MTPDSGAREALADLPAPLWGELLRAVRRAADTLGVTSLPTGLRPFARWHPDKLSAARPREAVITALVEDVRLRRAVADALDAGPADTDEDPARLVAAVGEERAVALLVAAGRWEDLAVVATDAAARLAAQDRAAAEADREAELRTLRAAVERTAGDLGEARQERDLARRRADAAAEQARRDAAETRVLAARVSELEAQVERLRAELDRERRRAGERHAQLRRRLAEAESRAQVDDQRALDVAAQLSALAAELRAAVGQAPPVEPAAVEPGGPAAAHPDERARPGAPGEPGREAPPQRPARPAVPRGVAAAAPGRPCRLPVGVAGDSVAAVQSLLQVPGLQLVLDGYNVTKDPRGRSRAELGDQRLWLQQLASSLAARYRLRVIAVFDGTDPGVAPPTPRGVTTIFTSGEESADERIVALVDELPADTPVLVVSTDREVRAAVAELGADVAASGTFLAAVDA